eukprot:4227783-Amphidinium_carterae.2
MSHMTCILQEERSGKGRGELLRSNSQGTHHRRRRGRYLAQQGWIANNTKSLDVESVVEHRKKLQSDQRNKSRQLNNLAAKVRVAHRATDPVSY